MEERRTRFGGLESVKYVINIKFLCNLLFRTFLSENSRERLRDHFELLFLILFSIWFIGERFCIRSI